MSVVPAVETAPSEGPAEHRFLLPYEIGAAQGAAAGPQSGGHAPDCVELVRSLDEASRILTNVDGAHLVVLYRSAVTAICAAADGTSPQDALEQWCAAASRLTSMVRANRRRIMLIEAEWLALEPGDAARAAGLERSVLAPFAQPNWLRIDPPLAFAAHAMVTENALALRLSEELEASALPWPGSTHAGCGPADLFKALSLQRIKVRSLEQTCERLHGERRAFSDRIERLDAMLSERDAALKAAADRAAAAEAAAEERENLIKALRADLADARREAEKFKVEAGARGRELTTARAETARIKTEISGLEESLGAMQAERDDLGHRLARAELWIHMTRSSISYRIMQPLRKLRGMVSRGGGRAEQRGSDQ